MVTEEITFPMGVPSPVTIRLGIMTFTITGRDVYKRQGNGQDTKQEQFPENKGTLMLDATCAPSNIRYPQDFSLLNEAREKRSEERRVGKEC